MAGTYKRNRAPKNRPMYSSGSYKSNDPLSMPLGSVPLNDSGVHLLPASYVINGSARTPDFRYNMADATATEVAGDGYGDTLSISGAGTLPTLNVGTPCLGSTTDAVKFEEGQFYEAVAATSGEITTEMYMIEVLAFLSDNGANNRVVCKRGVAGWEVYTGPTNSVIFIADDGGSLVSSVSGTLPAGGAWYFLAMCVDPSTASATQGGRLYLNGSNVDADDYSGLGSITSAANLAIGAIDSDTQNYHEAVAYTAMYKASDLWPTGAANITEMDRVCAERFARLNGVWSNDLGAPTVASRSSTAILTKQDSGVGKAYIVGDDWPRIENHSPDATARPGYLSEPSATNLCLQSKDLSTTWTTTRATIGADAIAGPDGATTADSIIADATDNTHAATQFSITLTAANYTFSAYIKAGTQTWFRLRCDTLSIHQYFEASGAGSVGTAGGTVVDAGIDRLAGTDWYRAWFTFLGTAGGRTFNIWPADSDNDPTFAGDAASASIYATDMQVELTPDSGYPSSPITTTTTSVARAADQLVYAVDVPDQVGSLSASVVLPNSDYSAEAALVNLSDGGASADHIELRLNATGDLVEAVSAATAGNAGLTAGTADITDGTTKRVSCRWRTDSMSANIDGERTTPDTSVDPPDDLDELAVGQDESGSGQPGGRISDVIVKKRD